MYTFCSCGRAALTSCEGQFDLTIEGQHIASVKVCPLFGRLRCVPCLAVPRVFDVLFRWGAYLGNDAHLGKI